MSQEIEEREDEQDEPTNGGTPEGDGGEDEVDDGCGK